MNNISPPSWIKPNFRSIKEGEYKEVIFAFFDILRFSQYVKKNCSDSPINLIQIFQTIDHSARLQFPIEYETCIISDSIVLWSEDLEKGILPIINVSYFLQSQLLQKGLLIRGVISKGRHFSTFITETVTEDGGPLNPSSKFKDIKTADEIIISPVLVECSKKEKSIEEPIIVIEPEANDQLNSAIAKFSSFRFDIDYYRSYRIIDGYFSAHEYLWLTKRITHNSSDDVLGAAKRSVERDREIILANLAEQSGRARDKWIFIAGRFNKIIEKSVADHPEFKSAVIN